MTDQSPINVQQEPEEPKPSAEHMQAAARQALATWQVIHQSNVKGGFARRVQAARDALDMLSAELDGVDAKRFIDADPLLEIRENPRLLRAVVLEAYSIRRKVERLPRVQLSNQEEETRIATAAA